MVLAGSEQRRKRFNPTAITVLLSVIPALLVGGLSASAAADDRSNDNADANAATSKDGNSPAVGTIDITISKETTFVKGPVREDGTINYVAALRKRRGKMPKPEDNVAAGLIEILGPDVIYRDYREEVCRKLAIHPDPNDQYMVGLFEFVDPNGRYGNPIRDQAQQEYDASIGSPWKAEDHRLIAAWINRCSAHLDDACRVAKRKRYRMPLSVSGDGLPVSAAGVTGSHRDLVRALCCRAMLRLGSGDLKRSRDDLEAAHLLARKCSPGMLVIDGLVRLAMDSLATNAGKGYLASDGVKAGDLRLYRKMLQDLPQPVDFQAAVEIDRLIALGVAMRVIRDARDDREIGCEELGIPKLSLGKGPVEWDAALRRVNTVFDRVEKLGRAPAWKRPDVRREFRELIDASYKRLEKEKPFRAGFSELLNHDKWARFRGEGLGDVVVCAVVPRGFDRIFEMESECVALFRAVRLGSALREYHLREGDLPDQLSALVKAKLIKQVPTDPFSGKPPVYRRTDEGFVLYSVGRNLRDDGGKDNGVLEQDDIVIRYPQPKADAKEDSDG